MAEMIDECYQYNVRKCVILKIFPQHAQYSAPTVILENCLD